MNQFDVFRINCWMDDLDKRNYESAINSLTCEYLLQSDNTEQSAQEIYEYITKRLGIKIQYQMFLDFINQNEDLVKEPLDDAIILSLHEEALQRFRERYERSSIENYIDLFCDADESFIPQKGAIKDILLKTIYKNINSFALSDLKSLISESIRNEFTEEEVTAFNTFLDWENKPKNKAIYSLFSKSIEFAILTSGRGVSAISQDIFTNKTYYLDTNVIIRALGVDGDERKESILSVLESCNHDGIKFKIAKVSFDELHSNIDSRTKDVKDKSTFEAEKLLVDIIEDLPLNNSFEVDYLKRRKAGIVKSPNKYRLYLEKQLQIFQDKFSVEIEVIKHLRTMDVTSTTNELFEAKRKLGRQGYSKNAALVDAKNILHVKNVRGGNNYNYRDIKSFYLTVDGTLNEIISNKNDKTIGETILPSQLFIIHNSFHKVTEEQDYKDFIKFIKMRRTDFKLKGKEVFNYLHQVREVTSDIEVIKSELRAYANYSFKNKNGQKKDAKPLMTLKEFTTSRLEEKLISVQESSENFEGALAMAIDKLPRLYRYSKNISLGVQLLLMILVAALVWFISTSTKTTLIAVGVIILFRVFLYFMQDKFGFEKLIRNWVFEKLALSTNFYKLYPNNIKYLGKVDEIKQG